MRILGLDTATRATVAALLDTEHGLEDEARDDPPPGARPRHAARLLALAAEVLERAGVAWSELDLIAVGIGPGTFTGLRIGVATARALAQAHGLALTGVGTLESLVGAAAGAEPGRLLVPVLDARRHEVFAAAWRGPAEPDAAVVIEPAPYPPQALADRLAALAEARLAGGEASLALREAPLAVGEGALLIRAVLERAGCEVPAEGSPLHRVSALAHCRLGIGAGPQALESVLPRYLRLPDAELALRR